MERAIVRTVPTEAATANFVPAAAVIRRWQALFGFTGRTGCVGGLVSLLLKLRAQPGKRRGYSRLEGGRGARNSRCSGEMRRDREEGRWRRRRSGTYLTLRHESEGSKQD